MKVFRKPTNPTDGPRKLHPCKSTTDSFSNDKMTSVHIASDHLSEGWYLSNQLNWKKKLPLTFIVSKSCHSLAKPHDPFSIKLYYRLPQRIILDHSYYRGASKGSNRS